MSNDSLMKLLCERSNFKAYFRLLYNMMAGNSTLSAGKVMISSNVFSAFFFIFMAPAAMGVQGLTNYAPLIHALVGGGGTSGTTGEGRGVCAHTASLMDTPKFPDGTGGTERGGKI